MLANTVLASTGSFQLSNAIVLRGETLIGTLEDLSGLSSNLGEGSKDALRGLSLQSSISKFKQRKANMQTNRTVDQRYNRPTPIVAIMAFASALVLMPQTAMAVGPLIVGDGTPASCTEQALRNALDIASHDGGDDIQFACGADPLTIVLASTTTVPLNGVAYPVVLLAPNHTILDGGGLITLRPNEDLVFEADLFVLDGDTTFTLTNLAIQAPQHGRCVFSFGKFHANGVTFSALNNFAIENWGELTIQDSTVTAPRRGSGPTGIRNVSTATVNHTAFVNNGDFTGCAISNIGTMQVRNSTFSGNQTTAITNKAGGSLIFDDCQFDSNFGNNTGVIQNDPDSTVFVKNCDFFNNHSRSEAGAIGNGGTLNIEHSTFFGNGTARGGAIANAGTLNIKDSTFSGNNASENGGAIYNSGTLVVTNSLINSNTALGFGGGIYLANTGSLTLKHTGVINNTPDDISPIH
jgi:predicted outer membrane repeat protein